MNIHQLIFPIIVLLACPCSIKAQVADKDVEPLVRAYFSAFQNQNWKELVGMLHPKSLEELKNTILGSTPRTTSEIDDDNRDDIEKVLATLSVKSPEEAWALRPEVVYLRMLQHSSKIPAVNSLKDVVTEIKEVKIKESSGVFRAEAEVESKFKGKIYSGTTYFIVEPFEGVLKVVAMTKTKRPPKEDEQGGADQPATAPKSKSEGKYKPQSQSKARPQ